MQAKLRKRLSGFTLVELLAVIAIIGILIALLLPAWGDSILDGTTNTLLVGKKHVNLHEFSLRTNGNGSIYNGGWAGSWSRLGNRAIACSPSDPYNIQFGSYHPGVCQFGLFDGSVRAVQTSISVTIMSRLANRQDGEVIPSF